MEFYRGPAGVGAASANDEHPSRASLQNLAFQARDSLANVLSFGLPDDYWNRCVDDVEKLTAAELTAAAARLARPEQLWVVVGDLAKIEEAVRKTGIG